MSDETDSEVDHEEEDHVETDHDESDHEGIEVERTATREEAATLLHDLADGVASGSVAFDDGAVAVAVPETLEVELEYEREDDEAEIEVELEWDTDDDGEGSDEAEADDDEEDEAEADDEEDEAEADDEVDEDEAEDGADEDEVEDAETDAGAEDASVDAAAADEEASVVDEHAVGETGGDASAVAGLVEPAEEARSRARFELYRDNAGEWRWRLVHHNGNIIADGGEGYNRKGTARNGLESVKRNAPGADVVEQE